MGRLEARVGRLRHQAGALEAAVRDLGWTRYARDRDYAAAMDALARDIGRAWMLGIEAMATAMRRESSVPSQVAHRLASSLHRDACRLRRLYAEGGAAALTDHLERPLRHRTDVDANVVSALVIDPATVAAVLAWCQDAAPGARAGSEDSPDAA